MALTLGVKVGDVVDVAEHWVAVLSVDSRNSATLISNDGQKIAVSSNQMTEMVPVWIGLGPDATRSRLRLVFEAPPQYPDHAAARLERQSDYRATGSRRLSPPRRRDDREKQIEED